MRNMSSSERRLRTSPAGKSRPTMAMSRPNIAQSAKQWGLADLSHRGKVRVTGEDRVKWLQSVISNDILSLQPGQGRYSSVLTHKGKMLTYFRLYMQTESVMLEDVGEIGDTTFQALRKFLLYGTKAKMENCAESWGLLLISGPKATHVLQSAFGVDVAGLKPVDFVTAQIGGHHALVLRTEETGEVDIEILVQADSLSSAWHSGHAGRKPSSASSRSALRRGRRCAWKPASRRRGRI